MPASDADPIFTHLLMHAPALNAVNDSQHTSHNYKQCRRFGHPPHHLILGGRAAAAAVAVTSSVGLTLNSHTAAT